MAEGRPIGRMNEIATQTYSMPVYWASYLINGDPSSLDDEEIAEADAAIEDIGLGAPVDVSDSDFRSRGDYGRLAGDYADYTFLDHGTAREPRQVRDYEAVDNHDRHIAGPFKSYGDARAAAGTAGVVKFIPAKGHRVPPRVNGPGRGQVRETRSAFRPPGRSPVRRR